MSFDLEDGVAIPPRAVVGGGAPRETQYPLDQWKKGQSFKLAITGREDQTRSKKDGSTEPLTVEQDAERQARQKASAISALAKRRGQAVVTRWNHPSEPGVLRVWHDGEYKAKPAKAAAAGAAIPQAPAPEGDAAAADTGEFEL